MSRESLDPFLESAVREVARTPRLLVVCDYDGTLSPIVEDPAAAVPLPGAVASLGSLASLPDTFVAIVSGRSLHDLRSLTAFPEGVTLVGSHGSEFDVAVAADLDPALARLRAELLDHAHALADGVPGVVLEPKPAGVSVHVRRASRPDAARVLEAVLSGPATLRGVHVIEGKEVVELSVLAMDKGAGLDVLRARTGAGATLFVGDDVTDERALARLHGLDVGVKVGAGHTRAPHRVNGPDEVAALLALLSQERSAWLSRSDSAPNDAGR